MTIVPLSVESLRTKLKYEVDSAVTALRLNVILKVYSEDKPGSPGIAFKILCSSPFINAVVGILSL